MPETVIPPHARREAVQPSLWDRLREDLPGSSPKAGGPGRPSRANWARSGWTSCSPGGGLG